MMRVQVGTVDNVLTQAKNQLLVLHYFANRTMNEAYNISAYGTSYAGVRLSDSPVNWFDQLPRSAWSEYTSSVVFFPGLGSLSTAAVAIAADVKGSSILDMLFQPVVTSGNVFIRAYAGYKGSDLYRVYPPENLDVQLFPFRTMSCSEGTLTSFRPRCRPWFARAVESTQSVHFGTPNQLDFSSASVAVTVSKAIFNVTNSSAVLGAVGADANLTGVTSLIRVTPILEHGYCFLLSSTASVLAHPRYVHASGVADPAVWNAPYEPEAWSQSLVSFFNTSLQNPGRIYSGSFKKEGATWQMR